jgi:hypothetical protein
MTLTSTAPRIRTWSFERVPVGAFVIVTLRDDGGIKLRHNHLTFKLDAKDSGGIDVQLLHTAMGPVQGPKYKSVFVGSILRKSELSDTRPPIESQVIVQNQHLVFRAFGSSRLMLFDGLIVKAYWKKQQNDTRLHMM